MPPAVGSLFGLMAPARSWDSVEAPPLVRALRWITLILWIVVFAAQFQAVVSGAPVQWMLLGLTTMLFVGVHLRFWYEESERGRQVHRAIDKMRGRIYEDEPTGLPNSRHFLFELRRQMMRSVRNGRGFALVLAEIQPATAADEPSTDLVKTLARAMHQALDPADFLARLQGNTFAVIIHDDDQLLSSQKSAVVGDVVVAAIPLEQLTSLQPAVSTTCYGGETQIRDLLGRAQVDFAKARSISRRADGNRDRQFEPSQVADEDAA